MAQSRETKVQDKKLINRVIFEMLDKEMRKVPKEKIQNVVIDVGLIKDIYPVNLHVHRVLKKFELQDHFYYTDPRGLWEIHFSKFRTKANKLMLSVIRLELTPLEETGIEDSDVPNSKE